VKKMNFWGAAGPYLVAVAEIAGAGAVGALGVLGFPLDLPAFDLLAGHVAAETRLDLGGRRVGVGVVQGDVQDVLVQLRAGSLLPEPTGGLHPATPQRKKKHPLPAGPGKSGPEAAPGLKMRVPG